MECSMTSDLTALKGMSRRGEGPLSPESPDASGGKIMGLSTIRDGAKHAKSSTPRNAASELRYDVNFSSESENAVCIRS
jgi:hypothetical protein